MLLNITSDHLSPAILATKLSKHTSHSSESTYQSILFRPSESKCQTKNILVIGPSKKLIFRHLNVFYVHSVHLSQTILVIRRSFQFTRCNVTIKLVGQPSTHATSTHQYSTHHIRASVSVSYSYTIVSCRFSDHLSAHIILPGMTL